jgi:hypothetical protein
MANNTGKKYGGRKKGTPNKLTSKLRDSFAYIISDNLARLDVMKNDMSAKELIDYTRTILPYVLPRQNDISLHDQTEKLPIINITISEPVSDEL